MTDPRRPGGGITGPGGPRDKNSVGIDMTHAVLLDDTTVAMVEPWRDGEPQPPAYAVSLSGRINKTEERASILFLMDADGAAAICSELFALASRMGEPAAADFVVALDARMARLRDEDAL